MEIKVEMPWGTRTYTGCRTYHEGRLSGFDWVYEMDLGKFSNIIIKKDGKELVRRHIPYEAFLAGDIFKENGWMFQAFLSAFGMPGRSSAPGLG